MKKHELPPGTRLGPGKDVFTVKPDGKGCRRKTRFVACGNYLPADEIRDLYAAGADATTLRVRSLRTPLGSHGWQAPPTSGKCLCSLPGKVTVAVMPPNMAIDMGLCEPDEVCFVDKALYGLRESPKLWGGFKGCRASPGTVG